MAPFRLTGKQLCDVDRVRFYGMLKDGESWDGERREENSRFSWRRDRAASWLAEGTLWDHRKLPFEAWDTCVFSVSVQLSPLSVERKIVAGTSP